MGVIFLGVLFARALLFGSVLGPLICSKNSQIAPAEFQEVVSHIRSTSLLDELQLLTPLLLQVGLGLRFGIGGFEAGTGAVARAGFWDPSVPGKTEAMSVSDSA